MQTDSKTSSENAQIILLDGNSLTIDQLISIGSNFAIKIGLTKASINSICAARSIIDKSLDKKLVRYGINTGFGNFANVVISDSNLVELQYNLIRSHCTGVGQYLSPNLTRMLLALRINVLAKGHSGISLESIQRAVDFCNNNCLSAIPVKGTVGASGDLAPLAHLALGLIGEGLMFDLSNSAECFSDTESFSIGDSRINYTVKNTSEIISKLNVIPLELKAKEGLALINGTQFISAIGAASLYKAKLLCKTADCVAAMTIEALRGIPDPFNPLIHNVRPHNGQILVAGRISSLLPNQKLTSEIYNKCSHNVQDSYSLRCIPQIHGITNDTLKFVESILSVELNSATDNPMVFTEPEELIISGGNFHGEYPAKALDYLAIGVNELGSVSERRIERLVNGSLSKLPSFLIEDGGLNSGFMIAHCTAAALVSENKCLSHPASVDSISTSAGQEDHVSMGGYSARKSLQLVNNVENIIAIELLSACQALDLLKLTSTPFVEEVRRLVRSKIPTHDKDRVLAPDIEQCRNFVVSSAIWDIAKKYVPPMFH